MWLVRDSNGELWLYREKPLKGKYFWLYDSQSMKLDNVDPKDYPNVRWEDDEPLEVKLVPK